MKLTILIDNNSLIDRYLVAEPALSIFIEADGKRILFDTGYSDGYIRKAQKLGIDLLNLDYVVLSHGHLDHTWGLVPLIRLYTDALFEGNIPQKPQLVAHPDVFISRSYKNIPEIGSILSEDKVGRHFNLNLSRKPFQLTEHLWFMGEINRRTDFEGDKPLGKLTTGSSEQEDFILDDTALAYHSDQGLIIITGCSHSGICNITEAARKVCNESRVVDIIGGLHLQKPGEEKMLGTVDHLKQVSPAVVHACHCTDLESKTTLSQTINLAEAGSGLVLEY